MYGTVMQKVYHLPIVIEHDEDGFVASCPALQGCYTQGATYEEVLTNIKDAIRLCVDDERAEHGELEFPPSVSVTTVDVTV